MSALEIEVDHTEKNHKNANILNSIPSLKPTLLSDNPPHSNMSPKVDQYSGGLMKYKQQKKQNNANHDQNKEQNASKIKSYSTKNPNNIGHVGSAYNRMQHKYTLVSNKSSTKNNKNNHTRARKVVLIDDNDGNVSGNR